MRVSADMRSTNLHSDSQFFPATKVTDRENVRRWDETAEEFAAFFADGEEFYHKHFINPAMYELLGDVSGKHVLDLACGEGHFARGLADRSKRRVHIVGVDASKTMIRLARSSSGDYAECIEFRRANAARLRQFGDAAFDVIACNMGLQDIKDYRAAVREAARLLKPGGVFVFSILHPCFGTPGACWIKRDLRRKDPANKLGWMVDNYFARIVELWRIKSRMVGRVFYFHRTLEDYVRTLRDAGLVIADLREPAPPDALIRAYPGLGPDLKRGSFLVVKCSRNPARKEIDEAWAKEAERRVQEVETGKVKTILGGEVFKKIRNRLRK